MGYMKKYIKKYWKLFLLSISFLIIEAIADLLQPTIMANMVDIGVANNDLEYVFKAGGYMLLITGIGAVGAIGRNIVSSYTSQCFGAQLRSDLFKKIQYLSAEGINNFQTSSLITRITYDVTQVKDFVHRMMRIFFKAPVLCIGSIIMAFYLSPSMSLILLLIVPIIAVIMGINFKIGFPYFTRVQLAMDKINEVMREYLRGVRVVKAFSRQDFEKDRFHRVNENLAQVTKKAMRVTAIFSPAITLTVNLGIVAILWFGSFLIRDGNIQVGKVIAFINYMTQILHSLMIISRIINNSVRAKASLDRIGEVFNYENTIKNPLNPKIIDSKYCKIEFSNVSFAYGDGELVLKDITFSCLPGETIGIIGSTGAGKSTLVNLIPRFFDVRSGNIRINDIDISQLDIKNLREKISIVPQKALLFTGTIYDNIRWGKKDATEDEIREVAEIAQAHSFITSFSAGYQTVLGQGGVNLSGGQKQRIAIARALLKKAPIMILDDSTSAVDVGTEASIKKGLKRFLKDSTVIIIAQRITSVMDLDKIVVLDEGEIVGIGNHSELLKTCLVYRDIYRSQLGREGDFVERSQLCSIR
ncbi:ABC transporter ATP-binding protein [Anaerobranca gottschalkii]|uniref:ATP-binding cassette, subfamily B n=1 Tax=Anaerobranca gottschalkii DSM 13577 TaxID=1120990 RepID=A0A1I0B1F6_9FIRM|nr:ABC transporter ATP-binding protein [Anaerobranca gottschalkii]SET00300.1 ATP-binding cassette, subfamily B [Anaerobranca gottschalkii DSM 13577]